MKRLSLAIMLVMFSVFLFGFLFGYFFERTGIMRTESKIDELRREVENMQLEQMLIGIEGSEKSCAAILTSTKDTSYRLYEMVNKLKQVDPTSKTFYELKRDADLLSLKAWILATGMEEKCQKNILSILYVYSTDCQICETQDRILQEAKSRYGGNVLVYAVDYNSKEPAIEMMKKVYGINWVPAAVIKGSVYGILNSTELNRIICNTLNCTYS